MLKPFAQNRWNFRTAAHLWNRAGFGGTPAEIEKLAKLSPAEAVDWFVHYEKIADTCGDPEWAHPDPERAEKAAEARKLPEEERRKVFQQLQRNQRERILELRGWWLNRMAKGPRPLQEKMVLFWHGHFATSFEKVQDAYMMWRQNELFRRLATADWLRLLIETAKDPAMLIWLDQAQSRKQHPNENFAREVMELFALGEGHYTEKDITEGARALTGWSCERITEKFVERPIWHDEGEKTIFGKTGNFDGEDFLELIVQQPQAARFITAKLWRFFAGTDPADTLVTELAKTFRAANNQFKPVLRQMFLAEEFYAPSVVRNQVKSPVQWLVGSARLLERELPPPMISSGLIRNLGQDLFAPPNVKGWDGGLSWITTNNLLARYNQAAMLVQGDPSMLAGLRRPGKQGGVMMEEAERRVRDLRLNGADATRLFTEAERADYQALAAALQKRLLQDKLRPAHEQALLDFLKQQEELAAPQILSAIRMVMSTPEYQLA
jgi:uncharacterized protein (DUF1800 family)